MAYTKLQARYWQATVAPANPSGKGINHAGLVTTAAGLKLSGYWVDQNDFAGIFFSTRDLIDHLNVRLPDSGDLTNCSLDCDLSSSGVVAIDAATGGSDFAVRAYDQSGILKTFYVSSIKYATNNNGAKASGTVTIGGTSFFAGDIVYCYINGWYSQYKLGLNETLGTIGAGLRAAINLNNNLAGLVTASDNNAGVVTITAVQAGTGGNGITLSSAATTPGNLTATSSGATLTGGVEPTSWHIHFDFNNLTDTTGKLVPAKRVDSLLWTVIPVTNPSFTPGSFTFTLDNWTPSGAVALGAEPAALANNSLGMSINFDAVWNLTPERVLNNIQKLGYNGRLDLFIGSEKYYRKQPIGALNYTQGRLFQVDTTVSFNDGASAWFSDFLTRAKNAGYSVMAEIGMESVDPDAGWAQQSNGGAIAGSQATPNPFLFVLSPSPQTLRTYLQNLSVTMAGLMNTAGLTPRLQFAEWQWWSALSSLDGSATVPFFYDSATKTAFSNANPGKSLYIFTSVSQNPNADPGYGLSYSSTNFLAAQYGSLAAAIISAVKASYASALFEADFYNPSIDPYPLIQQTTYDTNNYNSTKLQTFKTSCYGWTRTGDLTDQLASIKFPQTYAGAQAGNNAALGFTASNSGHVCGFTLAQEQQMWLAVQAEISVSQAQAIGVIQVWDWAAINRDSWLNSAPLKALMIPAGMTQQVKDLEGISSIGALEVQLIDPDGTVRALAGQQAMEGKTGRLLLGFPGLNSTEFVALHNFEVMKVQETSAGVWSLVCDDWQRFKKQKIFLQGSTDTGLPNVGLAGNGLAVSKSNPRVIRANPIDILLAVFQNELGLGQTPGVSPIDWQIYSPAQQAATLINPNPFVDVPAALALRDTVFAGELFEFSLSKAEEAKQFIEKELYKPNGIYTIVRGSGQLSMRTIRPPAVAGGTAPVWAFTDKNTMGLPKLERANWINKATVRFDYDGSRFNSELTFYEPRSIVPYDQSYTYIIEAAGLKTVYGGYRKAREISNRILRRYAQGTPVFDIESFLQAVQVEVGDYVTYTHPVARDPLTGQIGITAALSEVIDKQPRYTEGKISFKLLDTRGMKLGSLTKVAGAAKNLAAFPYASSSDQATYMFVSNAALGGKYSNGVAGNTLY